MLISFGCCLHTAKAGCPAAAIALASFWGWIIWLSDCWRISQTTPTFIYVMASQRASNQITEICKLHVSGILCRQLAADMLLWSDSCQLSNTSAKSLSQQEQDYQWTQFFGHPPQAHLNTLDISGYITCIFRKASSSERATKYLSLPGRLVG